MRTITQSSIKTNGTDGVIQVMPVSENRIKEGREVIAGDKAPTRTVRGDGTAPVDSKARHAARKDEMFLPATSIITGVLITGLEAPTSLSSKSEPMPVTMRIKKMSSCPIISPWICVTVTFWVQLLVIWRHSVLTYVPLLSLVLIQRESFDVKLEAYAVSENDGKMGSEARLSAEMVTQLQELHLPVDFLHLPVA